MNLRTCILTLCANLLGALLAGSARAGDYESCPSQKPIRDRTGMCYEPCKIGYEPAASMCLHYCAYGYTNTGLLCAKPEPYGRGAGYASEGACENAKGKGNCERSLALWYPRCQAGYHAVGCCICSPDCPAGTTDTGAACQRNSYDRGIGAAPSTCRSTSFRRSVPEPAPVTGPFYMVFASDPQLPWYSTKGCGKSGCELPLGDCKDNDACIRERAFMTNRRQIAAIESVPSLPWPPAPPKLTAQPAGIEPVGVIINGDLTSFGHPEQLGWLHASWIQGMRWDVYPGLGNHDYHNNLGRCNGNTDACAERMTGWMRSLVSCGLSSKFPASKLRAYDEKSMAYSWDHGAYHFVQTHNYPMYASSSGDRIASSSTDWLKNDLLDATRRGKQIILNMHNFGDGWSNAEKEELRAAVADTSLRAIFAGHLHAVVGKDRQGFSFKRDGADVKADVYRSGSPLFGTFLLVEFAPGKMTVVVVSSSMTMPRYVLGEDRRPVVYETLF